MSVLAATLTSLNFFSSLINWIWYHCDVSPILLFTMLGISLSETCAPFTWVYPYCHSKNMVLQWFLRQRCQPCCPLAKLVLLELFIFLVAPRDSQCKRRIELILVTGAIAVFPLSYHCVTSLAQTARTLQFFGIWTGAELACSQQVTIWLLQTHTWAETMGTLLVKQLFFS